MNNMKTTKRALFSSVLALMLCFAMLLGTTFAWFTDTAVSANNKIVAGTLDVELYQWTSKTQTEGTNISTSQTPVFTEGTIWEPGKTEVRYLSIKNNGTLALKYKVALEVTSVSEDSLLDVMSYAITPDAHYGDVDAWAGNGTTVAAGANATQAIDVELAPGAEHFFALSVHMDEEAGNQYMEETVTFDIKVLAGQLAYEKDSFNNQYDVDAMYAVADGVYIADDGSYVTMSMAGLSSVAEMASSDDTITSVTYVTENGEIEVPVARDSATLDSAIASDNAVVVVTNGDYTIDNAKNKAVTIVGNGAETKLGVESEGEYNTDYGFDGSTVVFENLTFNVNGYLNGYARMKGTYNNCIINGTYTLNGDSVFNNCTFNKTGDDYCVWTWGASNVEFNECTFNTDGKAVLMYGNGGGHTLLKATKCVFNDNGVIAGKAAIEVGSDWTTDTKEIVMTGCTVNDFDVTGEKTPNYGGTNLGTNEWGNKNLLPENRLTVTIEGQTVYGN